MQSPFAENTSKPFLTVIHPNINPNNSITIHHQDLKKLHETAQRTPQNTSWIAKAVHSEHGWTIDSFRLHPQRPSAGLTLSPQDEQSEVPVYVIKSDDFDYKTIESEEPYLLLQLIKTGLRCAYVMPHNNQILDMVKTVVGGEDPFGHLESEIRAEIAAKVRHITYATTYNNYTKGSSVSTTSSPKNGYYNKNQSPYYGGNDDYGY